MHARASFTRLTDIHFKSVKNTSEPLRRLHRGELTACLQKQTWARSRKRARAGTLDEPKGRANMAHTRAADDFQAIRARVKELRCERERAVVTETDVDRSSGCVEAIPITR